jgi:DNA replicative helicase MCM subunit Mcm2 (Cdc46/Mcm family)
MPSFYEYEAECNRIDEEGLEAITSSFCPEVFGYESIKLAILSESQYNIVNKT